MVIFMVIYSCVFGHFPVLGYWSFLSGSFNHCHHDLLAVSLWINPNHSHDDFKHCDQSSGVKKCLGCSHTTLVDHVVFHICTRMFQYWSLQKSTTFDQHSIQDFLLANFDEFCHLCHHFDHHHLPGQWRIIQFQIFSRTDFEQSGIQRVLHIYFGDGNVFTIALFQAKIFGYALLLSTDFRCRRYFCLDVQVFLEHHDFSIGHPTHHHT